ncbi:MAG: acyl-CoA thioesterase [Pseudomonadales bacterium]
MSDHNTSREHYAYFSKVSTRWMDNDVYQHINNVVYYSFFDTVCNEYLIERAGFNPQTAPVIGFIVSSNCQYLAPLSYPVKIEAAFRVNRLGNSSVEYGVAVFAEGESSAAAWGTYTHVFVNRESDKPTPIPDQIREALTEALIEP